MTTQSSSQEPLGWLLLRQAQQAGISPNSREFRVRSADREYLLETRACLDGDILSRNILKPKEIKKKKGKESNRQLFVIEKTIDFPFLIHRLNYPSRKVVMHL